MAEKPPPEISDQEDGKSFGKQLFGRPFTEQPVEKDNPHYNMNHRRRGKCVIFAYDKYHPDTQLSERSSAEKDVLNCKKAFSHLGFEVESFMNLRFRNLFQELSKVSKECFSDCDAFVMVFMSHGQENEKTEKGYLWSFDKKFEPKHLWKQFTVENCKSFAGKPKLFFIQACRGDKSDRGIFLATPELLNDLMRPQMKVIEDKIESQSAPRVSYVVPSNSDLLIMWASSPGYVSYRTQRMGIEGSVFIYFLTNILYEEGFEENLSTLLLKVTRKVAIDFETHIKNSHRDKTKQMPYVESTLMRKIKFLKKREEENKEVLTAVSNEVNGIAVG